MDKHDFKNNLKSIRNQIEEDYKSLDKSLRAGKYRERINKENEATTLNYYQLNPTKREPHLPDPTLKDYENTANAIQVRKDQLEADIMKDIEKEFADKNLIEQHLDQYFYDQPSKNQAKEHLYHPAKTAFNEESKKPVSQIFIEQVGQKVQAEKNEAILKEGFNREAQPPSLTKSTEDIPELETRDITPKYDTTIQQQYHYPISYHGEPSGSEPSDSSATSNKSSKPPSKKMGEPEVGD